MMIGVGDSLTYGSVGYFYIKYISMKVVNEGINGNPIIGLYRQLEKLLNNPKYFQADIFIVGIGTNDSLQRHSSIIQNLACKYNIKFIDTYHLMDKVTLSKNNTGYSWGKFNIMRCIDGTAFMLIPHLNDVFSKARNLDIAVDGVHFNSLSAKMLAKEVESNLVNLNRFI